MDILKILSRGTKKSAAQNVPATIKPTAKKTANPQLYNDPTRGTKRKRTEQPLPEQTASDSDDDEVDFFAPKDLNKVATHEDPSHDQESTAKSAGKQDSVAPALLDEDEVRQVLRSHRLKFTLLSSHEDERAAKVKKSKKKQRTAAPVSTKSSKDSKRSLYPQPLTSFTELRSTYNVSARVCSNLAKQGFRLPTEVQLASLPLLLSPSRALASSAEDLDYSNGIDFLAVAPTGSGKTLTFLIPSINDVLRRRADGTSQEAGPTAIIIAPTRELAHQIANEGKKLAQGTGVKIVGMKKGMAVPTEGSEQEDVQAEGAEAVDDKSESEEASDAEDDSGDEEKKPKQQTITKADILVTTPMMLLNFLNKGSQSRKLPSVRSLILDEADVLLDPLFRDQTMGIWNACNSPSLRVTLWSATMGANIESLVAEQLKPRTSAPLVRLVVGLKDTAVPSIKHKLIYTATEQGKLFALRQLLHPNSSTSNPSSSSSTVPDMRLPFLVFAPAIYRATALHNELQYDIPIEAGGSSRIAALHSSMSESARAAVISRFRAGEIWVLVTTDLLMRGIDFHGVNGVINYDVPTSAAAYVHRVGRTGRAGNRDGCVAVTLYTTEDVAHLKTIANVIALSEKQAAAGGGGKSDTQRQLENDTAVPKWLMDALPKVGKDSKKKLRERGVESRRSLHGGASSGSNNNGNQKGGGSQKPGAARITSKSAWERRKEHNRRGAIEGSRNRKKAAEAEASAAGSGSGVGGGDNDEWGGLDD